MIVLYLVCGEIIMIKIVVIDGQEPDRERLRIFLSAQNDFEVVGVGKDGYEAIRLVETLKPDIALLDISLHYIDGVKVTSILKFRFPGTSIIILTTLDDDEYVFKAIYGGASGYLLKTPHTEAALAEGIRTVYNGGSLMTPKIATKAFRIFSELVKEKHTDRRFYQFQEELAPELPNISRTELRITAYVGQGLPNKEIAEKLRLRIGTVRNYISSILQKTGLRDRTQLAIYAIKNGLINQPEKTPSG
jgi:DNA-binding NarL/FixJ family response regulator